MTEPHAYPESQSPEQNDEVAGDTDPTTWPPVGSDDRTNSDESGEQAEPVWPGETTGMDRGVPRPNSKTLVGCTVATAAQTPAAQVLKDSFLQAHPDAGFVLLSVDPAAESDHELTRPSEIGVDDVEFARLAMACSAEELRDVLRPRLLAHLVDTGMTVLYLEPSVQIFGDLGGLLNGLEPRRPIALVPRVLRPLFVDGLRPSVGDLATAGAFDPSVFAVSPGAEDFLASWSAQARVEPAPAGTFLDGAPALIDHHVIRDSGVGLSVWNAAQRELSAAGDGTYRADGQPLRSIHFEGFQPQRPWLMSVTYTDRPRVLLSEHPVLAQLCAGYRNALVAAGYTKGRPHSFDTLPGGTTIPTPLRANYLAAWSGEEETPSSPFETASDDGDPQAWFLEWACTPGDDLQREAGGSRWTAAVWADDPALRAAYPEPFGADAEAFHEWCAGVGIASGRVPAAAIRRRAPGRSEALVDQLGVSVLGQNKLADLVRAAVRSSGLPSADTPYYPVVLRCSPGVTVPAGRHVIDVRPDAQHQDVDTAEATEAWVLSEASLLAMRRIGATSPRVITLPVLDPGLVDTPRRKAARARFALSDEFVIAAVANHGEERQDNVLGLIRAFLAAFPERGDIRLLVCVSGGRQHPEAAERLRLATASDPRIVLAEDPSEAGDDTLVSDLQAAANCVTSLHRAEGGDRHALLLLEAVAMGVPVVAGDHGAVGELLGERGAKLVACQGVGEPDIDAAAAILRSAADDPDSTAEFGRTAREHILAEHNVTRAGERLRERVESAYRNWRVKWAKDRHGQLDDPLHPLLAARHALHRTPEVAGGNAMAPALRKAVLKAVSHYDQHIRDIMRTLVDGVEQTAAELLRRQHVADGGNDLESLRGDLARFAQRQDQLAAELVETEDGMVRARADLAEQDRRLRGLETEGIAESGGEQLTALLHRVDSLTNIVERTLDRMDVLEQKQPADQPESSTSLRAAQDASFAVQRTDVLQRIMLREHERNTASTATDGSPVLCDAGVLRLPVDDAVMLPWLSSHDSWDPGVSALIDSLLEPDGIFLDVGAYVGYQTVRVLSRLGNSGAVVAVEPCPRSRELLWHNIEVNVLNGSKDRLIVLEDAAWDDDTDLVARRSTGGGLAVHQKQPGSSENEATSESAVQGIRLDGAWDGLQKLEGIKTSVVHVDVGDQVHRILRGLTTLLWRDQPSIVCTFTPHAITERGDDPLAVLKEFVSWGYELVPVGREHAVAADELLEAMEVASSTSTVKLWLRPNTGAGTAV